MIRAIKILLGILAYMLLLIPIIPLSGVHMLLGHILNFLFRISNFIVDSLKS